MYIYIYYHGVKSAVIYMEFQGEMPDSEIARDIFLTGHSAYVKLPIKKEIETVLLRYNFPIPTQVNILK